MKPQIEVLTSIVTERRATVKITGELIVSWLRKTHKIPDDAKVQFTVPSGGDWSGMKLDINAQDPVWVTWTTQEVKDERV